MEPEGSNSKKKKMKENKNHKMRMATGISAISKVWELYY